MNKGVEFGDITISNGKIICEVTDYRTAVETAKGLLRVAKFKVTIKPEYILSKLSDLDSETIFDNRVQDIIEILRNDPNNYIIEEDIHG